MMAAGQAAELGAKVLLIEKNESLGKKLLITGGGRCNLSQAEFKDRIFADKLGKKRKIFIISSFSFWTKKKLLNFLKK